MTEGFCGLRVFKLHNKGYKTTSGALFHYVAVNYVALLYVFSITIKKKKTKKKNKKKRIYVYMLGLNIIIFGLAAKKRNLGHMRTTKSQTILCI